MEHHGEYSFIPFIAIFGQPLLRTLPCGSGIYQEFLSHELHLQSEILISELHGGGKKSVND